MFDLLSYSEPIALTSVYGSLFIWWSWTTINMHLRVSSNLTYFNFIAKSLNNAASLNLFELTLCIFFNELINVHKATADSNFDCSSFLDFNKDSLLSESINIFGLSKEHDFNLFARSWGLSSIDVVSQDLVILVTFFRDVNIVAKLK